MGGVLSRDPRGGKRKPEAVGSALFHVKQGTPTEWASMPVEHGAAPSSDCVDVFPSSYGTMLRAGVSRETEMAAASVYSEESTNLPHSEDTLG
jgi:hypothetical protein